MLPLLATSLAGKSVCAAPPPETLTTMYVIEPPPPPTEDLHEHMKHTPMRHIHYLLHHPNLRVILTLNFILTRLVSFYVVSAGRLIDGPENAATR